MHSRWSRTTDIPPLAEEGVQVWRLDLTGPAEAPWIVRSQALLLPDELKRAASFAFVPARDEFLAARGLLRLLLGAALKCGPREIRLAAGAHGKPFLSVRHNAATPERKIDFNVSHSGGLILVAVARGFAVGVDVELIDPAFAAADELLAMAREALSPAEYAEIARVPAGSGRHLAFYRAWTRKEAIAKADGRGIAEPLDYQTRPEAWPDLSRVLLSSPDHHVPVAYSTQSLPVGGRHVAALATTRRAPQLTLWDAADLDG